MTISTWVFVLLFFMSDIIAILVLESSMRTDKKLEKAQEENNRLKEENAKLKREIYTSEIMALLKESSFGGGKF